MAMAEQQSLDYDFKQWFDRETYWTSLIENFQ